MSNLLTMLCPRCGSPVTLPVEADAIINVDGDVFLSVGNNFRPKPNTPTACTNPGCEWHGTAQEAGA